MKKTLRGPCGAKVDLDRSKVIPDDPGADTPAIVRWGRYSGTFWCCMDTGEISCGDAELPRQVTEWLHSVCDQVNEFLYGGGVQ